MGSSHTTHLKDLDVHDATPDAGFGCADLTTFCRLNELGLVKSGSSWGSASDATETGNQ